MTKKKMGFRDLKCRNGARNQNLREKLSKIGLVEKFWLWSKSTVNGQSQRSTADVAVWRHLGLTWQEERAAASTCGAWVRVTGACGRVRRVAGTSGAWRRVWCSFWPFLVGFCSGLAVLSSYAFSLVVEWAECWYLRVASIVGVTAQRKNAGDVHRNQRVRGMALIPC